MSMQQNPQPVDAAVVPRFAGLATFMRLPAVASAAGLDIALTGIRIARGPATVRAKLEASRA